MGRSGVSTSGSRFGKAIPTVRPKDRAAVTEDGRHQEVKDGNEADAIAGIINNVSLPGTPGFSRGVLRTEGHIAEKPPLRSNSRKRPRVSKNRSMSIGVNQMPNRNKNLLNDSTDRSNIMRGNAATSKSLPFQPETAFGDFKESRHSSVELELFNVPQLSSRKIVPYTTNKNRLMQVSHSHKDIAIEVEATDFSNTIKLIPDSEDEHYEQHDNRDLPESSPVRKVRLKTSENKPLSTHHYLTRSRSANIANPTGQFKRSHHTKSSESETLPDQPKEPKPRLGRGPVPKLTRQLSTSENHSSNMGEHPSENSRRCTTDSGISKDSDDEENPDSLRAMLEGLSAIIGKLGQRKGVNGEMIVLDKGFTTADSPKISKTIKNLIKNYNKMWEMTLAESVELELTEKFHQRAVKYLDVLEEQCSIMLAKMLGNHNDSGRISTDNRRTDILRDIYIHVVPGLVDGLKAVGKPDYALSELTIENIQELLRLLKILYDFAERTYRQDKSIQPKVDGKVSYPLTASTHLLRPILVEIREKCEDELRYRRTKELQRTAPARAKKRREREAKEASAVEEEFQQRLRECNRRIHASLEEKRRILGLPPCSQPDPATLNDEAYVHNKLRSTEFERRRKTRRHDAEGASVADKYLQQRYKAHNQVLVVDEEKRERERHPSTEKPHLLQLSSVTIDDDEWHHDELQGDPVMQVGLFGRNNLHPGIEPKEWAQHEIQILIKGLRQDHGPTRYEKVAMRLDRTLDEIFEKAKDLRALQEYTLKRLQEENPDINHLAVKPWIRNIGTETKDLYTGVA